MPEAQTADARSDLMGTLAALLVGGAAFLVCVGWHTLLPTNIAWLDTGDRAMHQLGWMFFRHSPWGMPPGISPNLGVELANSIGLVDGLSLFAFPFKLIEAWLPEPFQYWGYWLLLCFVMQALLAYRIARILEAGPVLAVVAAAFVVTTPAFLFRVPMHMALSGHWLILLALLIYVRGGPVRLWTWPLLIALTTVVHLYLLAMVLGIWVADLFRRLLARMVSRRRVLGEFACGIAVMLVLMWAIGFMMTGSLGASGYGAYKFNLLGFIIPYRWSEWFPQVPHTELDYEGLSFLGIGIMALLVLSVISGGVLRARELWNRRWLPLVILLALMLLFSVSNKVAVADMEVVRILYPRIIVVTASLFRSTGRFIWPLLYLLIILAVVMPGWRWRQGIVVALATLALGVQLYDSRTATQAFRVSQRAPAAVWVTELQSPFWERAAEAGYNRVRAIPYRGIGGDWKALSYYANSHGMDTDAVYLGRVDDNARNDRTHTVEDAFAQGRVEPLTIYVVDPAHALQMAAHLGPDDLLAVIDHRIVYAYGGAALVTGLGIDPHGGIAGTD
ncbi:MAG: DUF6311 domain-containing protein [Devosia sp.]